MIVKMTKIGRRRKRGRKRKLILTTIRDVCECNTYVPDEETEM